jgi:hypothetical protein
MILWQLDTWVLCRIYCKKSSVAQRAAREISSQAAAANAAHMQDQVILKISQDYSRLVTLVLSLFIITVLAELVAHT